MLDRGTMLHGRYKILRLLDQSDFGHLYLARDRHTRQLVEVKVITRNAPDIAQRFSVEAELLAVTRQPTLPMVVQYFVDEIGCCLVTEHIRSTSLEALRIRRHPPHLSEAATLALTMRLLDALELLHATSLFHRDIRPANIRLAPNGRVVLTNPGIASQGDARRGSLFGVTTPGFSPVEQRFGEANVRTDLYALGATLYTILGGITPPPADRRVEGDGDPLTPIAKLRPDISQPFADAVQRLLNVKPRDRYPDIATLRADLVTTLPVATAPDASGAVLKQLSPLPFLSRRLALLVAGATLLLTLILVVGFFAGQHIPSVSVGATDDVSTPPANPSAVTTNLPTATLPPPITVTPPNATITGPVVNPEPSGTAVSTSEKPSNQPTVIVASPTITVLPTPTFTPEPSLAVISGTLKIGDFQRIERRYRPYQANFKGETFDRGERTKNIWLGGKTRRTDAFVDALLTNGVFKLTLQPGQDPMQRWFVDTREVGRRKSTYIVQLDVAFLTPDAPTSVGIAFDVKDEQNAQLFEIFNDRTWQVRTKHDGAFVPELSTNRIFSDGIVPKRGTTNLWLVRLPKEVQLWIGGQHVATIPAESSDGGYTGVVVSSVVHLDSAATLIVDNFRVRAP